jgi:predicted nucleic acid-binding protein
MPAEAAYIPRRASLSGEISADNAALAHSDLVALRATYFPYEPFASRAWQLRENVTSYDACHDALAESIGASVATIDRKLSSAPGDAGSQYLRSTFWRTSELSESMSAAPRCSH